jgi:hypothetical protein
MTEVSLDFQQIQKIHVSMEIAAKNVLADFLTIVADVVFPPDTDNPSELESKEDERSLKSSSFARPSCEDLHEYYKRVLDNPCILKSDLAKIVRLLRECSKSQEYQLGCVLVSDYTDTGTILPLQGTQDFLDKSLYLACPQQLVEEQ